MRNPNSHIDTNAGGVSVDVVYNQTTTCPLVIVSSIFNLFQFYLIRVNISFHSLHTHFSVWRALVHASFVSRHWAR